MSSHHDDDDEFFFSFQPAKRVASSAQEETEATRKKMRTKKLSGRLAILLVWNYYKNVRNDFLLSTLSVSLKLWKTECIGNTLYTYIPLLVSNHLVF